MPRSCQIAKVRPVSLLKISYQSPSLTRPFTCCRVALNALDKVPRHKSSSSHGQQLFNVVSRPFWRYVCVLIDLCLARRRLSAITNLKQCQCPATSISAASSTPILTFSYSPLQNNRLKERIGELEKLSTVQAVLLALAANSMSVSPLALALALAASGCRKFSASCITSCIA
jgi:hypothetical protein